MPKAFILVDINPGHERFVQQRLKRLPSIKFAYQVTGEHDLIPPPDWSASGRRLTKSDRPSADKQVVG